jgi:hypothetical protein
MSKLERFVMVIVFGSVVPIGLFEAGWWISVLVFKADTIWVGALIGLVLGILIDLLFLRKWLSNVYVIPYGITILVYLFYMVGLLGFFMGFPVFNIFAGIMAGVYQGRKMYHFKAGMEETEYRVNKTCWLTMIGMAATCIGTTLMVFKDVEDTAGNLEGMFHLSFEVTPLMILAVTVAGGMLLIISQFWLTKKAAMIAYKLK